MVEKILNFDVPVLLRRGFRFGTVVFHNELFSLRCKISLSIPESDLETEIRSFSTTEKGRKAQKNPFFLIIFEILSRKDTNNNRALFVAETETVEKYYG